MQQRCKINSKALVFCGFIEYSDRQMNSTVTRQGQLLIHTIHLTTRQHIANMPLNRPTCNCSAIHKLVVSGRTGRAGCPKLPINKNVKLTVVRLGQPHLHARAAHKKLVYRRIVTPLAAHLSNVKKRNVCQFVCFLLPLHPNRDSIHELTINNTLKNHLSKHYEKRLQVGSINS